MKELLQNKKLVGAYILWATTHTVLLIISWGTMSAYENSIAKKEFWPFTELSLTKTYDMAEVIIYCIVPAGLIISSHYLFPKKDENK